MEKYKVVPDDVLECLAALEEAIADEAEARMKYAELKIKMQELHGTVITDAQLLKIDEIIDEEAEHTVEIQEIIDAVKAAI